MESPKFFIKDLQPESSRPIEDIEKERADFIERAQQELEIISPSLKDLADRIETEKPDVVLFLDKGARILAAPFRKYLHERMGEHAPRVQRYNDDALKTPFLRGESIDEVVMEDFLPLSGKKVFYIDETFSSGKGAVALEKAANQAGVDMRYFALTHEMKNQKDFSEQAPFEPGKFYNLSMEDFKKESERIQHDPRFTIYPNDIPYLFTKDAAVLSVVDADGETKSRYELVSENESEGLYDYKPKRGEIPPARHYDKPPEGLTWREFDENAREINMRTVRTLTHMIYDTLEKAPSLDVNIVSLNYCKSIDEMTERIQAARAEGKIDSVLLGEYDFKVEEVISELEKIRETARQNNVDIILAPDNQFGRAVSWGQIKREFQEKAAIIEETNMPDEHQPETIGVFVGKTGFTYVFPKTWHMKEVHRPVHKIPNTKIGVTICGEIHHIKPEDLEGINILYNPSREGDDPYLKFRMLHRHSSEPLTREIIMGVMLEDDYYKSFLDDSQYDPNSPDYVEEYDSREERERRFNKAVDDHLAAAADPKDSGYVKNIVDMLKENNIPVVRTDGARSTGVLNQLPKSKIEDLDYREGFARYRLKVEK